MSPFSRELSWDVNESDPTLDDMVDRPSRLHVVIIDGTLSRLTPGFESNAGQIFKLLREVGPTARQSVAYDPGVQGTGWSKWLTVAAGTTINRSIEAGYAALASRYTDGDRIMLFGYSRGAYAVRSLAGFIGRVGLLRRRHATERRVTRAFRYYTAEALTDPARRFSARFCRRNVPIDFIGVFDTVDALGLPYPMLSRLAPMAIEFHDHRLSHSVRHAAQALALDETRTAYRPVLWDHEPGWDGRVEQAWFPGGHADVGGQVGHLPAARPLSNIPLRWILERAELHGLELPPDWRDRYPEDAAAPAFGSWRRNARYFLSRAPRVAGRCPGETLHKSAATRAKARPRYRPTATWTETGDIMAEPPLARSSG